MEGNDNFKKANHQLLLTTLDTIKKESLNRNDLKISELITKAISNV